MKPMTSVLIVDDEPSVRNIMARWATSLGLLAKTATNADDALTMLRAEHCDLVVVDVMMPGHDGLWLAAELTRQHPGTAVVIATAYTGLIDGRIDAPVVADLLVKPFARDRFVMAVERGRQWRKETLEELAWHARLSSELRDLTDHVCRELAFRVEAGAEESDVLSHIGLARMPQTMAHGDRVARYALSVARELGLNGPIIQELECAARFHDIGKIVIPESLIDKPSPLTQTEQRIMRRHVETGAEILDSGGAMHAAAAIVLATHEWFGGAGYPRQLVGTAIPLASRIIAVVDAYDAMTQDRQYRSSLDSAEAVSELLRCRGTQFDPDIVGAFLAVLGRH